MLSFPESDPVASSSHEKSQAEDKPNTGRMAKPREFQRKIQNPDEAFLEEVVWTNLFCFSFCFSASLYSIFYYLQQKQLYLVEHLSDLVCFVLFCFLTSLYYLTLPVTFWNFVLLGLQSFSHLLLFKGNQHIPGNKHVKTCTAQHTVVDPGSSLFFHQQPHFTQVYVTQFWTVSSL